MRESFIKVELVQAFSRQRIHIRMKKLGYKKGHDYACLTTGILFSEKVKVSHIDLIAKEFGEGVQK